MRTLFLGLAALSLAWAIGGEWTSVHRGFGGSHLLEFLSGLSYLWAGLYALWKRPGNVVGTLLYVYGVLWFLSFWLTWTPAWLDSALSVVAYASGALLVHLALAFPTGRIDTRFGRWTVAIAYVWLVAMSFATEAANGRAVWEARGYDCAANYCRPTLGFWQSPEMSSSIAVVASVGNLILIALTLVAFTQRWRRSTPIQRRELRPLWIPLLLIVATFAAIAIAELVGAPTSVIDTLRDLRALVQIVGPVIIVYGLVHAGSAAAGVSVFVRDIRSGAERADLQAALSRALDDPTLTIRFPDDPEWAASVGDEDSPRADRGTGPRSDMVRVRDSQGAVVAAIFHDRGLDRSAVEGAVGVVGLAVENSALHDEVVARLAEVEASRSRIARAADDERRRVERDLHDGAQQRLLTLAMKLGTARRQVAQSGDATASLDEATDQLRLAIAELRELARGIHPALLTDSGVGPAVRALADRSPVPVTSVELTEERFSPAIESTVYFVVAEALTNVAKHSQASSVAVAARSTPDVIEVVVADDGVGGARRNAGSGLRGLADRVAAADGTLELDSPHGGGTRLTARIPREGEVT